LLPVGILSLMATFRWDCLDTLDCGAHARRYPGTRKSLCQTGRAWTGWGADNPNVLAL
jgi:hypothetical protein